jgi:hypothetical protein
MKHVHKFRKGRGSVDVCACGRFRHNEKAGPAIVEQKQMKDVIISNHGSIMLFALLSERAREWVDENVSENRQFLGGSLAVEPRYAADLAQGMIDAGLVVE